MVEKIFCENCRKENRYTIEEKKMTGIIRGTEYSYTGKEARCAGCGAYVYVPEILDSNLESLYNEYRENNGIISLEKVRALPVRYAIGKRPLSRLLGWGEHTFSRFLDGDIPTRQYSETMDNLYSDPRYYLTLLEARRGSVSKHTYDKSRKAAERLINGEYSEKIDSVIIYLLWQCEDITPLSLQKALYYIQGFFYAFYSHFMFDDDCEAWAHGPVYRGVYSRYADYHFNPIVGGNTNDLPEFSSEEKSVIDSIIRNICCYSGKILEKFTHSEGPWIITRGGLDDKAQSNKVIEKKVIGDFFCHIRQEYSLVSPEDISIYSRNLFSSLS